jgi:hypothetical protein
MGGGGGPVDEEVTRLVGGPCQKTTNSDPPVKGRRSGAFTWMLSSFICSEISLVIMDQNSKVLISTMILGRLFCQGGLYTELMQTPTTNCPKLNCNTLQ